MILGAAGILLAGAVLQLGIMVIVLICQHKLIVTQLLGIVHGAQVTVFVLMPSIFLPAVNWLMLVLAIMFLVVMLLLDTVTEI
jgi:hypothetical protein